VVINALIFENFEWAIIGLFQYDPWFLPTQKWLKNATNNISIQEFHNVTRHYVKDTGFYDLVVWCPINFAVCCFSMLKLSKLFSKLGTHLLELIL
jgi:hypothetical protein